MHKNFKLHLAQEEEVVEVDKLFDQLIAKLDEGYNYPKWTRGAYPNYEYLLAKQKKGELYLLKDDDKIVGATVLNHDQVDDYNKVDWSLDLGPDEILVMHSFAIKEDLRNKGLGSYFLDLIINKAREDGIKSIHFDTIYGNDPAKYFYQKNGFTCLGQYELHYDETPETRFYLFERNLIDS